jgi:chitinase
LDLSNLLTMLNFKRSSYLFLITLCVMGITTLRSHAQFKVVGYLVNWGNFVSDASSVDYTRVTHINIAFLNPDASGVLSPTTNLSNVVTIVHNNNRKILASLGGASAPASWGTLLATSASRTAFINQLTTFVSTYNLDGIDIDLEGNLFQANTITSAQYEAFAVELGTALHGQNKLMTSALATWFIGYITNTAAQQFDWINVMSYDAYGTWTGPGQHSSYNNAVNDLNTWLPKVTDKSKLVLGVPSYGYGWTGSTSSGSYADIYSTIVNTYPRAANQDSIQPGPGQVIYYNGIPTIKAKTSLALSNASGIMMWTLQDDLPTTNSNSLILAIDQVVQAASGNTPPTVSMTAPANNSSYTEGDAITVSANATDNGSVTQVSFYAFTSTSGSYDLGDKTTAPYTAQLLGAGPGTYKVYAKATDNDYATSNSDTLTITINNTSTEVPVMGGPWNIPGKIEAENFDAGKEIAYHDSDNANQGASYRITTVDIEPTTDTGGGYDVGWTVTGEWLNYTVNVTATANYNLSVRVATTMTGRTFHIEMDGVNVTGSMTVPNTGAWQAWTTITVSNIPLTQGQKIMKIVFDSGDFNVNYVSLATSTVTAINSADASGNVTASLSPNPFSDQAQLNFSLKEGGQTKVVLNNMIGAAPQVITEQYFGAGDHSVAISGLHLTSGIYLCTITSGDQSKVIKIVKE